jgi:uncharacterized SAM-dependent methyltransferase
MYLPIDVALTEMELANDFLAAAAQRRIPEKFFYWFPLSVRAWLALCGDGEYRNFSRSHQTITSHARELAAALPDGAIEVVSLGAGQGDKDRILLEAFRESGRGVQYRPVDASIGLLEIAVRDALADGLATRGLKADFTDGVQLGELIRDTNGATRLFMLLGNTLGGFDPSGIARMLAAQMRPQDLGLIDGELFAGAETLAGYDNPVNRRFAFAPLAAAGITDADGTLAFRLASDADRAGLHRVEKAFTATRDATMLVAGESIPLRAGDTIEMSASHKYDEPTFFALLRDAGLLPTATYRSADRHFLMTLVRRGTR